MLSLFLQVISFCIERNLLSPSLVCASRNIETALRMVQMNAITYLQILSASYKLCVQKCIFELVLVGVACLCVRFCRWS